MPTVPKSSGKGQMLNAHGLRDLLEDDGIGDVHVAWIEQVHAMPKQGVSSAFGFGRSVGAIEGVVAALYIPTEMVTPQEWKKRAGLLRKPKDAARGLAIRLFPDVADRLARKKDVGRADALLIAHFMTGGIGG